MTSNKTFLDWLIGYNAHSRLGTAPVHTKDDTSTPPATTDWRAKLTDAERGVLSLANAGQLGVIQDTILKMKEMLDGKL